jgi:hypothetical protein
MPPARQSQAHTYTPCSTFWLPDATCHALTCTNTSGEVSFLFSRLQAQCLTPPNCACTSPLSRAHAIPRSPFWLPYTTRHVSLPPCRLLPPPPPVHPNADPPVSVTPQPWHHLVHSHIPCSPLLAASHHAPHAPPPCDCDAPALAATVSLFFCHFVSSFHVCKQHFTHSLHASVRAPMPPLSDVCMCPLLSPHATRPCPPPC